MFSHLSLARSLALSLSLSFYLLFVSNSGTWPFTSASHFPLSVLCVLCPSIPPFWYVNGLALNLSGEARLGSFRFLAFLPVSNFSRDALHTSFLRAGSGPGSHSAQAGGCEPLSSGTADVLGVCLEHATCLPAGICLESEGYQTRGGVCACETSASLGTKRLSLPCVTLGALTEDRLRAQRDTF